MGAYRSLQYGSALLNNPTFENKTKQQQQKSQLMTVWQIPDQERINQNDEINHKTTLPYYNYA